jgi:hypothetical protein
MTLRYPQGFNYRSRLYGVWVGMKRRCYQVTNGNYRSYGARGIKVCAEWHDYEQFLAWALQCGYRDDLQIDRINGDGDYEPSNCRWVTPAENWRNKRPRAGRIPEKRKTLAEWLRGLDEVLTREIDL